MENALLIARNLSKRYPGVVALKKVNIEINQGTVHCIVGENGAGKSTFIKILTCAEERTEGEIVFNGVPYAPKTIREAMNLGISTLFQELNVVNQLTVEENLTLGRETVRFGVIKRGPETERALNILAEFAPDIPLKQKVGSLSFAEKQVVEIVKAVATDAELIIMDEPTAAVTKNEALRLFSLIRTLKAKGITIIYISHILSDIFTIGDYVSVFRDGEMIGTRPVNEISRDELVKMMIGKVTRENYLPRGINYHRKILEVKNLSTEKLHDISFDLYEKEIIGFYGLRGAGKSEIAQVLFGLDRVKKGQLMINGQVVSFRLPKEALFQGVTLVPEERLTEGLIMLMSMRFNLTLTNLKKISRFGVVNGQEEKLIAEQYRQAMNIKSRSIEQKVSTLSGGNQQKVVVSKCLHAGSKIFLMDEPTRGIDVGAKEEIHRLTRNLAEQGNAVVVFSSEYTDIVTLCDRIFLLCEGEILKELQNKDADAEQIMHIITRGKNKHDEIE